LSAGAASPPNGPSLAETQALPPPPVRELAAGTVFAGRYQVIEDLGRGGMGRVYKVFDTEVREKLALKLIRPEIARDAQSIERFRDELKLARTISHRHVCRMHDLGREQSTYYITMEYVSGEDLKSLIHRIGALPVSKAVSIARQICDGLQEAHEVGVIHRDLKPQNIMIDREGNARIMDFGLARAAKGKRASGAKAMIGTPAYMSPEQVDGKEVGPLSDLYSLGIVLFEMLTGRLPFDGDTALSVAVQHKTEPVPDPRKINPQIPEYLKQIVLKCLQKSREKRYQSARELAVDLAKIQESLPTPSPLPLRDSLTSKQITLRVPQKRIWIPAIAVLAALGAFAVWQFRPRPASTRPSIAVLAFRNQTGDAAYDYLQETIPNLLITSLEQSGHFRVTTMQRLKDLLRQSGKDAAGGADEAAGFEICRREGIEALAVGFYTKAGDTFVTDVKVLDAATGQPLKTAQSRGEGPASILKTQIDEISHAVSHGIGLPALRIAKPPPRVVDVTTNSLEAYNLFLRGQDEYYRWLFADARASLEKALAIDSTFAVAWLYLSRTRDSLQDLRDRDAALEKAKRFSEKATDKERRYIEAQYANVIEKDPDRQFRILNDLVKDYPTEKIAWYELGRYYHNRELYREALAAFQKTLALDPEFGPALNLMAYGHSSLGEFQEAISCFERYAALNPDDPNPQDSVAELYLAMGRLDESVATYRALVARLPRFFSSWVNMSYAYALQENYAEVGRCLEEFARRAPSSGTRLGASWIQAYYDYLLGRWDRSLAGYLVVEAQARQTGENYFLAATNWITGLIFVDRGEFDRALGASRGYLEWTQRQAPAIRAAGNADQRWMQAWVELRRGRLDAARTGLREMEKLLPQLDPADKDFRTVRFQLLSAEVALASGAVDEAIEIGQRMVWPRFVISGIAPVAGNNQPFLKDVLARAYWKKGDLDRAAAEYVKLTTISPDNQLRYLIHPLYHYRFGRVLEEKGNREAARVQYRKFLDTWKDADPDHPELEDARRRLAAL
jgi:serine/threonine protein kinase/tetratricopeptide (TPR) repeat protein